MFDLGGVLIDWNPRYLYRKIFADEAEMEHFLDNIDTTEWNNELDRGRAAEEATATLASQHPEYAEEIEAYYGRWEEMLGGPIEGSVGVLRELYERGIHLCALTNFSADTFPIARRRYGFLGWFGDIVVSGEEGEIKPAKEIYEILVERTGLEPAKAVFLDDSPANVEAARHLGFTGITYLNPQQLRGDLVNLEILPAIPGKRVSNA